MKKKWFLFQKVGNEKEMARFSSSSSVTTSDENQDGVTSYKVSGNKANYLLSELDPATYYEMTLMSKNSAGLSQDKYLFGTHTIAGSESFIHVIELFADLDMKIT